MKRILGSGLVGLLVATVLAVGLVAGCGGTKTASTGTTPASSITSPAITSSTATSTSSPSISTAPSSTSTPDSTTLPRYMPSSVVSDTAGSLQLTSPDSVQKLTAFYDNALSQGGWTIVSTSKTTYSTNITARKGGTGTTLSISVTGSGTYISLTTYKV
jgi:hypothetical protein